MSVGSVDGDSRVRHWPLFLQIERVGDDGEDRLRRCLLSRDSVHQVAVDESRPSFKERQDGLVEGVSLGTGGILLGFLG
jgi:hypothetical protein